MIRTDWKFQEVREAVAALVGDHPADTSYIEVAPAYQDVAKRMGLNLLGEEVGGYWREPTAARDRLWAQVRRALDELCGSQGKLVKVGRGMYHPSGAYEAGATYYPIANYERADAASKAAFRERDELARAWASLHARLTALGFSVVSTKGQPVTLDLDGWEEMVTFLEASQSPGHHS